MVEVKRFDKVELELEQVYPEKIYSKGKIVKFSAHSPFFNNNLQPVMLTVFNETLQAYITKLQKGAHIIADIQESPSASDYPPDRVILQVYQDGKPVRQVEAPKKTWAKPVTQDTRSMDGRAAMFEVGSYIRIIPEDEPLPENIKRCVAKYWQAVERSLDNFLAGTTQATTQDKPLNGVNASTTTNGGKTF